MKGVGEPCAAQPHARFDGRELETECHRITAPAPDPTQLRFFLNSYIVAVSVTVLTLFVAIMAAYAFSRFNFPGKTLVNVVIVSVQAVPPITLVIPYFGGRGGRSRARARASG